MEIDWLREVVRPATRRALPASERSGRDRNPLPASALECAQVPGYKDIRFWGDVYSKTFERTLYEKNRQVRVAAESGVSPRGLTDADFLSISGGGDKGAFSAGFLAGWSERGDRPVFEAVTGVSAGALASPFAFLGSDYDDVLFDIYTMKGAPQLYRSRGLLGFFSDALNDTSRLDALIREYATADFLGRIAEEHRKGRRLFVMTTNLDAQRQVIWNMSAIAASGRPDRCDLFVKILRASSALPGLFPPVKIDVVGPDGQTYDELHVDGGVTAEVIFVPPESQILHIEHEVFPEERRRSLFVLENGKLSPEYDAVDMRLLPLAARAVATLVKYQVVDNLIALSVIAKATNSRFCFNAIPMDFDLKPKKLFDLDHARKLYECGRAVGCSGQWSTTPPLSPTHVLARRDLMEADDGGTAAHDRCLRSSAARATRADG